MQALKWDKHLKSSTCDFGEITYSPQAIIFSFINRNNKSYLPGVLWWFENLPINLLIDQSVDRFYW